MIGAAVKQKEATVPVPQFVRDLHSTLKTVYSQVREGIKAAHHRNKARYDQHTANTHFSIGDQVWLYVPAVKTGTTKKLACLWRGPYTIIDKLSMQNYRIQLLGVPTKTLVVHHNRLKHCFGTPKSPPEGNSYHSPVTTTTQPYSDVVRRPAPGAGYTTSLPDAPQRGGNSGHHTPKSLLLYLMHHEEAATLQHQTPKSQVLLHPLDLHEPIVFLQDTMILFHRNCEDASIWRGSIVTRIC